MSRAAFGLLLCICSTAFAGGRPQAVDTLSVTGDVDTPLHLTRDDLAKYDSVKISLTGKDGTSTTYTGVSVADILKKAGVVASEHPGKAMAVSVTAVGTDGYEVVFGLGELTPAISGRTIILAYLGDGKPLGANVGPFRIVVDGDKMQARCARMVTELQVTKLRK